MRDVLADATKCYHNFRKPASGPMSGEMSFREITYAWQCQPLRDADKSATKECQIKIEEDGTGGEGGGRTFANAI